MWTEVALFFLLIFLLHYVTSKRPKGIPPGPRVYPIVGSGFMTNVSDIKKCHQKYGDIFRTEIGTAMMVYLCNFKDIKEAFSRPEFANRPEWEGLHFVTDGRPSGVILPNGKQWTNARRFLLRNLRDLGMGKSYLDQAILHEAQMLVEDFKKHVDKPTKLPFSINIAVLNVIWQMVASIRYDFYDEKITQFIKILKSSQGGSSGFIIQEVFPWIKAIIPWAIRKRLFGIQMIVEVRDASVKYFEEVREAHKAKRDPDNPRDVMDEYMTEIEKGSDIAEYFSETDLIRTALDLFVAGFDTGSNMLRWIFLYMAKYPEVQREVQKQIDEVVPRDTLPAYKHKSQLPYVEALIHEALRMSSLIAGGVLHATSRDTSLGGYYFPKGTVVFGVTAMCHDDPRYWENPKEFKLERFLDGEGRFTSQKEGFIPFSLGRRSCLGESLARMELFLFTAALLQNFTFSPPEGKEIDDEPQPNVPLSHFPKEQDIVIKIREKV